jgi:hypothetical protein
VEGTDRIRCDRWDQKQCAVDCWIRQPLLLRNSTVVAQLPERAHRSRRASGRRSAGRIVANTCIGPPAQGIRRHSVGSAGYSPEPVDAGGACRGRALPFLSRGVARRADDGRSGTGAPALPLGATKLWRSPTSGSAVCGSSTWPRWSWISCTAHTWCSRSCSPPARCGTDRAGLYAGVSL